MNRLIARRRPEIVVPAAWALGTVAALVVTLSSLRSDDFDGLNNIFQLPFAFPWVLLPTAIFTTHYQDAWVVAGEGLLNAVLLHRWLRRRSTTPT